MDASCSQKDQKIQQLETQIRHLQNELRLTQTEYQNLINGDYNLIDEHEKILAF